MATELASNHTVVAEYSCMGSQQGRLYRVYVESNDGSWSAEGTVVLRWTGGRYEAAGWSMDEWVSSELGKALWERFTGQVELAKVLRAIEAEAAKA